MTIICPKRLRLSSLIFLTTLRPYWIINFYPTSKILYIMSIILLVNLLLGLNYWGWLRLNITLIQPFVNIYQVLWISRILSHIKTLVLGTIYIFLILNLLLLSHNIYCFLSTFKVKFIKFVFFINIIKRLVLFFLLSILKESLLIILIWWISSCMGKTFIEALTC